MPVNVSKLQLIRKKTVIASLNTLEKMVKMDMLLIALWENSMTAIRFLDTITTKEEINGL
jgi:hypothetical protein